MTETELKGIEGRAEYGDIGWCDELAASFVQDVKTLVAEVRRYQRALAFLAEIAGDHGICTCVETGGDCPTPGNEDCQDCWIKAALAAADEVKP